MTAVDLRSSSDAIIPFVLRLGVVGHRDLLDPSVVRDAATSALAFLIRALEDIMPAALQSLDDIDKTPLKLRVMSPLAEGADRIVVKAAFGVVTSRSRWTAELAAIIPYNIAAYRDHDCSPGESRNEFDALLAHDPRPRVLHHCAPSDESQRDSWYRDGGQHVADRCDVLISLWDGVDNHLPAGTAATTKHGLEQGAPVLWIPTTRTSGARPIAPLGLREVTPTLMLTSRLGGPTQPRAHPLYNSTPRDFRNELVAYFKQEKRRSDFVERLRCLEKYNQCCRSATSDGQSEADDQALTRDAVWIPADRVAVVEKAKSWIAPRLGIADQLAGYYQKRFRLLDATVYALSAFAVTLGALTLAWPAFKFHDLRWVVWLLASLELAALLVVFGIVVYRDTRGYLRARWVGFRAVAEFLRSGEWFFYAEPNPALPSPVPGHEWPASDPLPIVEATLSRARIVPWFGPVIEDIWDERPQNQMSENDVPWIRQLLLWSWVLDQRDWHKSKSKWHDEHDAHYRCATRIIFGLSVLLVIGHLILHGIKEDKAEAVVAVIVIALASAGAAVNSVASHLNHRGHADRYRDLAHQLELQAEKLAEATTLDQLRQRATTVRRIMLAETSAWFEGMFGIVMDIPT